MTVNIKAKLQNFLIKNIICSDFITTLISGVCLEQGRGDTSDISSSIPTGVVDAVSTGGAGGASSAVCADQADVGKDYDEHGIPAALIELLEQ